MSHETKMNVLCREADRQVIRVENETGSAYLTNYVIYPGISIAYMDAHIQEFSCYARPKPGVFAINHCEEGRIECNFKNGELLYMGKGDMSVGKRSCSEYCHTAYFPISHYHGLSLLIDTKQAQPVLDRLLEEDRTDLQALCDRFCRASDFGVIMQENEAMKHLFYELYHVPQAIRLRYCRLKVLEILLFLGTLPAGTVQDRPFLTRRQSDTVKAVQKELRRNLCRHQTIEELAAAYGMAPTTLKRCFKDMCGTTIYQYQKEARIAEAMRQLAGTDDSILHIANGVGYENSSKFAEAFKKMTGLLPKDYRKVAGCKPRATNH